MLTPTDNDAKLKGIEAQMRIALESAQKLCGESIGTRCVDTLVMVTFVSKIAGEIFRALRRPTS